MLITLTHLYVFIYIFFGIIVAFREHNLYFKKEYDDLKDNNEPVDDNSYVLYLLVIAMFWPLNLIYRWLMDKKKEAD